MDALYTLSHCRVHCRLRNESFARAKRNSKFGRRDEIKGRERGWLAGGPFASGFTISTG